mgnify:CR=1 FL=1
MDYTDDLLDEIAQNLQRDYGFKLKAGGKYLREGLCPSCAQKEMWTYAASPWVIKCARTNNCGHEAHAKELYPDLFESWTDRFQKPELSKPVEQQNPNAAADAYLKFNRGFELDRIRGLYTQEVYTDHRTGHSTATVRFKLADTHWERLIDKPGRFSKKANFKAGGSYAGHWWAMPSLTFIDDAAPVDELWLVEGIFDAIALAHHGIHAVSLMSSNNYPEHALQALDTQLNHQGISRNKPKLVWALDGDTAGRTFTRKHVKRARDDGWTCLAAQIPQKGKTKLDWNDAHQRDMLQDQHLKDYRYHGALLIAATAKDKALLTYNHTGKADFDLVHDKQTYWFKLDLERYNKAIDTLTKDVEGGHRPHMSEEERRELALAESGSLRHIATCDFSTLYYQRNDVTAESWYYMRVRFPHTGADRKDTFTAGHLSTASEFKKRLLEMAPGAMFSGSSAQLERIMQRQLYNIRTVKTVDFVGYSREHSVYVFPNVAVHGGQIHDINKEDFFEVGNLSIKTLQRSIRLDINPNPDHYTKDWQQHLWAAFGVKGYIATAFWLGSLFAEQIRHQQASFPFLEIVGEPGSGKSTLIQFLWKLLGRDYEGFDPSKSTSAGRMRTFTQVAGLPIVLIESDRETKSGNQAHIKSFDWDELKDAYNGNSIRTTGVKTGGNETYDPPFRASIVISQNNPVQASQAIMERICHMTFDTRGFTPSSYESAKTIERYDIEQVSGFILSALKREPKLLEVITSTHEERVQFLLAQDGIAKPRIAKNHAQLLGMCEALRQLVRIHDHQFDQVREQIITMARERQHSINADHPLVAEFWECFEYLDTVGSMRVNGGYDYTPLLNHSADAELIAVNLSHFAEVAANHRQQIPVMAELKKALKTSKKYRFVDIKTVNSAIKNKSVYCWVFEAPKH